MEIINNLFKNVFSNTYYIVLAVLVSLLFFLSNLWLTNHEYIEFIWTNDFFNLFTRLKLSFNFFDLLSIKFSNFDVYLSIIISILFGINISALWFYLKKQLSISKELGSSLLGAIISALGIGCASCGSVVVSSFFGIGATTAFLGFLPFGGSEFGVIGVIIMLYSIYLIAKKIDNNFVCEIK